MISIFKVSASYKFIFLFILYLAIRLPFFIFNLPLMTPELEALLVAKKMDDGAFLYREIWDDTGPLYALLMRLLYAFFGERILFYRLLAGFLIFAQALILNQFLRQRQVFQEITLVPALIYLLGMSCYVDFYSFNPVLLSLTFHLLVIRYMLMQISERSRYNAVFEIGAYTALATLCYLPAFLILPVVFLFFPFYTASKLRDYFLMSFAFMFTIGIAFLVFYLSDSEYEFYLNFFKPAFEFNLFFYVSALDLLKIFAFPVFLVLLMVYASRNYRRYTNYQNKCINLMILGFLVSLFNPFFSSRITAFQLALMMPFLAFLLTHYFLNYKSYFLREIVFLFFFFLILLFSFSTLFQIPLGFRNISLGIENQKLFVQPHPLASQLKGKKVLVLGNQRSAYWQAALATPYLNWRISRRHFSEMDQYDHLVKIQENFEKDPPDFLVEENANVRKLFEHIPLLAEQYKKIEGSNVYQKMK